MKKNTWLIYIYIYSISSLFLVSFKQMHLILFMGLQDIKLEALDQSKLN